MGFTMAKAEPLTGFWELGQEYAFEDCPREVKLDFLGPLASHYSGEEIERFVIPRRTMARRRANDEALTQEETDKALRLARIGVEADRVFGDPQKAARWLR